MINSGPTWQGFAHVDGCAGVNHRDIVLDREGRVLLLSIHIATLLSRAITTDVIDNIYYENLTNMDYKVMLYSHDFDIVQRSERIPCEAVTLFACVYN